MEIINVDQHMALKKHSVFMIAEIGQAHEGSLGIAHSYIDALSKTGVDAIKFQTHIAEAESSEYEKFRVNFSYEDKTRFDYWKRMEFTLEQWIGLKKHCEEVGLEFISSPFSIIAVDLLEKVGVKRYKIGSGEVNNRLLIDKICKTGKEIFLSSGMSSFEELDDSVNWINLHNNKLSVFQCTTNYPTIPQEWGLNVIQEMKKRYRLPIGFSDHSGEIYASLAAITLGAELIEFHAVFDKEMFGPDAKSSLTIQQIGQLVKGVRQIEEALNEIVNKDQNQKFAELKTIFGKSLCVNNHFKAGHIISFDDLEAKKPRNKGVDALLYLDVIGKTLRNDINKWDFLNYKDLLE
jgi:N,N'-diacetyllegionaminate synthase